MSEGNVYSTLKREAIPKDVRPKRCRTTPDFNRSADENPVPACLVGYTRARRQRIPTDPCWTFSLASVVWVSEGVARACELHSGREGARRGGGGGVLWVSRRVQEAPSCYASGMCAVRTRRMRLLYVCSHVVSFVHQS